MHACTYSIASITLQSIIFMAMKKKKGRKVFSLLATLIIFDGKQAK